MNIKIEAKLKKVLGDVTQGKDEAEKRVIKLVVETEFDDKLAVALHARDVRKLLRENVQEDATVPMGVAVKAALAGKGNVTIAAMYGRSAYAWMTKSGVPCCELVFNCDFTKAAWAFLGENLKGSVTLETEKLQGDLDLPEPEPAKPARGKKQRRLDGEADDDVSI